MAILTWRNVNGPDFGGANSTFRDSAALMDRAFTGAADGLDKLRTQPQEDAANQLSMDLGRQRLQSTQQTMDLASQKRASEDAARQGVFALQQAASSGDPAKMAAVRQQYAQQFQDLPLDQIPNLFADSQGTQSRQLGFESGRFNQDVAVRDDTATTSALEIAKNIRDTSASPGEALRNFDMQAENMDPRIASLVRADLAGTFGDIHAPDVIAVPGTTPSSGGNRSGGSGNGVPGTRTGDPADVLFGFAPSEGRISQTPIREVLGQQAGMIRDSGHSPVGAFQITRDTLADYAPKVLGENWGDEPLTLANQDKISKALFEDRKDRDLTKTWASLPDKRPGAYKDVPWAEMRQILSQGEVGSVLPADDPATLLKQAVLVSKDMKTRSMSNNARGMSADMEKLFGDVATPSEAASRLVDAGGMVGAEVPKLVRRVSQYMDEFPGVSAAQVATAISRNTTENSWLDFNTTTDVGGNFAFKDEAVRTALRSMQDPSALLEASDSEATANQQMAVDAAAQSLKDAQQALRAKQARQRNQQGLDTQSEKAAVDRAMTGLQSLVANYQSKPELQAQRPEPEQPSDSTAMDVSQLLQAIDEENQKGGPRQSTFSNNQRSAAAPVDVAALLKAFEGKDQEDVATWVRSLGWEDPETRSRNSPR